uniref:RNA-directed DNA polymerase n=1 Tax=Cacopsylla melanoneura TaxID=428564 RepID=A0A8D8S762_9HEMI
MLLALQKYDITVSYLSGKKLIVADFLSRAPMNETECVEYENVDIYSLREKELCNMFETINQIEGLDFKNTTIERIKQETDNDEILQRLIEVIKKGWPRHKENLQCDDLYEYWEFRDELSVDNGVILRSDTILIPKSMRSEMLTRIHKAHQGKDQCIRKARASLFWPRMSHDIEQKVKSCSTCNAYPMSPRHLPMQTHETPSLPWERVAADVFHVDENNYIIVVDYYSDYFEIEKLNSLSAAHMILCMKKIFAIHGVPNVLVTDGAPQFINDLFKTFASQWEFTHITSSPLHSQGNGKAESAVKIAKQIIKKTRLEGVDPFAAILEWRNSPTGNTSVSPVQKLMSRKTRSFVPVVSKQLQPNIVVGVPEAIDLRKRTYKYYYDKKARNLPDLEIGQGVRVKPQERGRPWMRGRVEDKLTPRSYVVKTANSTIRRNREYLVPSYEPPPLLPISCPSPTPEPPPTLLPINCPSPTPRVPQVVSPVPVHNPTLPRVFTQQLPRTTKSGRVIKTPDRWSYARH